MDPICGTCCGIDVHKKKLSVCLLEGNNKTLREYKTTTSAIMELKTWLESKGCELAAMESTGSYWKPLYNVLEASSVVPIVVNPQHIKNVPGRKTDTTDAQWIAELAQCGLLSPSFIPERKMREFREIITLRNKLTEERSAHLNRIQNILEGGNIKLSGTVTAIGSGSGRNMLQVIIEGKQFDSATYDELYAQHQIAHNLKASKEEILEAMNGCLSATQAFELKVEYSMVDELSKRIQEVENFIVEGLSEAQLRAIDAICQIPGMGPISAEAVISVIGTDMSRFPDADHLASWAGLCPGNNESAGKRRSGRTRKGNKVLRTTLVRAAHAAVKDKTSFFSARYKRVVHRGKKRAYVAVAHAMLTAIYHVLKDGTEFKDLGADFYDQFNTEHKIRADLRRAQNLGASVLRIDDQNSLDAVIEEAKRKYYETHPQEETETTP